MKTTEIVFNDKRKVKEYQMISTEAKGCFSVGEKMGRIKTDNITKYDEQRGVFAHKVSYQEVK